MITKNIIAGSESAKGADTLTATNPATQQQLEGQFAIATIDEIDEAVTAAYGAWHEYKNTSGATKAVLLRAIADNIEAAGDALVDRAMAESGLPAARIKGERGRTCGQLRLFATVVEEGSWVRATIDTAQPDRKPMARVDIRKMEQALGPVAVFGASNFPLAFSTAGGDTASALAAGCPVVVKGHPSHLGTHAIVSAAITKAVKDCGLPAGVFSAVTGGIPVGAHLVKHPLIKAVGFTGSLGGGNGIMKACQERAEPIPVYAEMGSINPIFLMPSKLEGDTGSLASTLANSVNMGVGQFCTNPGILVVTPSPQQQSFIEQLGEAFEQLQPYTMLNEGIYNNFEAKKAELLSVTKVKAVCQQAAGQAWSGYPALATTTAAEFVANPTLHKEVFGPFSMAVICSSTDEVLAVANALEGQLTSTIMGSESEVTEHRQLVDVLREKAGRVIFNGVPTGVEVGYAMHHGGPYPSASSPKYTSVGTDAILRFVRPICLQNAPQAILPTELQDGNPLGIWRLVDGEMTRD